jgi:hypothetical protein
MKVLLNLLDKVYRARDAHEQLLDGSSISKETHDAHTLAMEHLDRIAGELEKIISEEKK